MKVLALNLLFLFSFLFSYGQTKSDFHPCGTPTFKSDWLIKYQSNPQNYNKNGDDLLYIPLTIHVVGSNGGGGYFPIPKLLDALCTLNDDFIPVNIQFYIKDDIRFVDNSSYFTHETILEGAEMMFDLNVPNTLNCYVVTDPAGNCGYNLPYAGIALAKSCLDPGDHTWAHEVGHGLSLPHPFFGWEGGVSHDNSVPFNYNNPAPEFVLADYTVFKDTLILDTLIIDTVQVEKMDGSNCLEAADGFCDTAPDYIANRWNCDANMESGILQHDPNNVSFKSDGTLIMSYSDDACAARFSNDQIAAMRANLLDEKGNWLDDNLVPLESVANSSPNLIYPIDNEAVAFDEVELRWQALENASVYTIQISIFSDFSFTILDEIVKENKIVLKNLEVNRNYYYKLQGFNEFHFCTSPSAIGSFETIAPTSVATAVSNSMVNIYPTPLKRGSNLTLEFTSEANENVNLELYNSLGELVLSDLIKRDHAPTAKISLDGIGVGTFILSLRNRNLRITQKIIIL